MTRDVTDDGERGTGRRTFLKTVGVAGAAAAVSGTAAASEVSRTVEDSLDVHDASVQETLVTYTDDAVAEKLDSLDVAYRDFEVLPIAYAELDGAGIKEVASWDGVRRVVENSEVEFDNHDSQADTNAREVWESPDLGYTGENVHVAVVDSGLDAAHPGLADNVEANYQYVGNPTEGDLLWQDVSPGNCDWMGHGTHCAGSVCGDGDGSLEGDYAGMAPDASLTSYAAPMLSNTRLTRVAAYEHILAGNRYGDHDIQVVSNSWTWGNEYDPWHPVPVAVYHAYREGVLAVFSAGNDGPDEDTLGETLDPFILNVAAANADMSVADFSSRGVPGGNFNRRAAIAALERLYEENLEVDEVSGPLGLERPSVIAKGAAVMSTQSPDEAYYGLGALDTPIPVPPDPEDPPISEQGGSEPLYGTLSGTSMSCPTTAGVVALFLDAYYDTHGEFPDPIDTINTIEATAREDAHPADQAGNGDSEGYTILDAGAGYVDAMAAVERAVSGDLASFGEVVLAPEPPARGRND